MQTKILHAWEEIAYQQSLSLEEQSLLPVDLADEIELTDADLEAVYGGLGGCLIPGTDVAPTIGPSVAPTIGPGVAPTTGCATCS